MLSKHVGLNLTEEQLFRWAGAKPPPQTPVPRWGWGEAPPYIP